jgi:putative nucleotidyltransferase with HDIG domain
MRLAEARSPLPLDYYLMRLEDSRSTRRWNTTSLKALSAESGAELKELVAGRRRDLTGAVLHAGNERGERGSLGTSIFVNSFLDALAQELASGERTRLNALVEAPSDADGGLAERRRAIVLTCAALSAAYAAECGRRDEVVQYLALRASDLERRAEQGHAARMSRRSGGGSTKLVEQDEVVTALQASMEALDHHIAEHLRSTAAWCGRLADALGMGASAKQFAMLCGELHDIGKIATPRSILTKPGPLTAEEWVIMRAHPVDGAIMLEKIPSLRELAPVVRAHHERIDGRGYPDGLVGDEIPLMARLVAVADAFDAMISNRPYRRPLSVSHALRELESGRGTQWDAVIVDAILGLVIPARATRQPAVRTRALHR